MSFASLHALALVEDTVPSPVGASFQPLVMFVQNAQASLPKDEGIVALSTCKFCGGKWLVLGLRWSFVLNEAGKLSSTSEPGPRIGRDVVALNAPKLLLVCRGLWSMITRSHRILSPRASLVRLCDDTDVSSLKLTKGRVRNMPRLPC